METIQNTYPLNICCDCLRFRTALRFGFIDSFMVCTHSYASQVDWWPANNNVLFCLHFHLSFGFVFIRMRSDGNPEISVTQTSVVILVYVFLLYLLDKIQHGGTKLTESMKIQYHLLLHKIWNYLSSLVKETGKYYKNYSLNLFSQNIIPFLIENGSLRRIIWTWTSLNL